MTTSQYIANSHISHTSRNGISGNLFPAGFPDFPLSLLRERIGKRETWPDKPIANTLTDAEYEREERAATLEYCARLPRAEAEARAGIMTLGHAVRGMR